MVLTSAQAAARQDRVLTSRKGTALSEIAKRAGPGAETVVIEKDQSPPLFIEPPPGTRQLEWMTSRAPFVLVVRIEGIRPELTPEEDWIISVVTARVVEDLKAPSDGALHQGSVIRWLHDGGQLDLSGRIVRAVLPWSEGFEPGERYLVFAEKLQDHDMFQVNSQNYRIDDGDRLRSQLKRVPASSRLRSDDHISLADAVQRIRAVK